MRMQPGTNESEGKVGERAYQRQVERIVSGVLVADDLPAVPVNAIVLGRATGLASQGDYLGAIHVLGEVQMDVDATSREGVDPEDVEQALGDLRRALSRAPAGPEREASAALLEAARTEASGGRWLAAWELIDEADARLASAYAA